MVIIIVERIPIVNTTAKQSLAQDPAGINISSCLPIVHCGSSYAGRSGFVAIDISVVVLIVL